VGALTRSNPGRSEASSRSNSQARMHDVTKFFRANPQAFVLLVICIVLGLGTFLVVIFGLLTAGSSTTTGEPSGVIAALHLVGR